MALSSAMIFAVSTTAGSNNNGGGFVEGTVAASDGVIASGTGSAPTLSSSTYSFQSSDVNAWVYFQPGQASVTSGWYQISSVSSGTATLNAAIGAAQLSGSATNSTAGCATSASVTSVKWAVDYSQSGSAIATGTVTSSSTTVTATASIFTPAMVGNCLGDGTQLRQITAYTSGTVVTVDAAPTWSSSSVNVGGQLASTNFLFAGSELVSGQTIYAVGKETRSTAMTAVGQAIRLSGYGTTRNDGGKYWIQATAGMATLFSTSQGCIIENIKFDGNGQTFTSNGVLLAQAYLWANNLEITGIAGTSVNAAGLEGTFRNIWVHANATTGAVVNQTSGSQTLFLENLEVNGNPNAAIAVAGGGSGSIVILHNFLIYNNGGNGLSPSGTMMQATNGVIYGAGSNGVSNTSATNAFPAVSLNNVIIANSTSKALAMTNTANNLYRTRLSNVYQYNNGTASTGDYWGTLNTLSANPFVNASSGNFALSPTSAAFATLGGVGFTYPSANTVDYSDIGGAQHAGPTVPAASTVLSPTAFGYSQTGTLALAAAADVLSGINRGDGTLGTLNASNLNTALGNGQPDATAGIIENGKIIGNITGTYAPSVSGGGASGFGLLPN